MKALKPLRVVFSSAVALSLILIFTDFYRIIPSWFRDTFLYFQLSPSALSFAVKASAAAAGFIIIIIITLYAGRIYCSFLCPLGYSQDIFIRIGNRLRGGVKYKYSSPHFIIFYSIFALSLLSFIVSGTFIILWLDPFSIFGRFITYGASYPAIELNNIIASFLIKKNIFSVHSIEFRPSFTGAVFSISFFTAVMALSIFKGRLYCNTICPAGAMLSLISRISFMKVMFNRDKCIKCGRCEKICKSSCIDYSNMSVDNSRCVSCFNCISHCPNGSITLSVPVKTVKVTPELPHDGKNNAKGTITRMSFISGLILIPQLISSKEKTGGTLYYQEPLKQKKYNRLNFSSPPGSQSIEKFNSRCTACSLCISACPTSVLQPAVRQYGLTGIMQPFMDFTAGFCNYDCTVCGDVCPTDAISKNIIDTTRQIQTGKSYFIIENCITYTNGTDCGACSEHCPTKAVHMVPYKNGLVIPEVNRDICTGCGACEYACPVRPLRAIYVEGSEIHGTAKLPEQKKVKKSEETDFPF